MAYAIMRCSKLKGGGAASSLSHTFRERETLNADPERTADNEHLLATSTDQAMGAMRDLLPSKYRKDAVLAVEYLFTTSPEWAASASPDQQREFFDKSSEWLAEKHGAQNVFVATIHKDETTPHLVAYVVPITTDGRLCAKDFLGGREKLRDMQSTYAEKVKHLGLERGIEGSAATHKRIKQHYTEVNKDVGNIVPEIAPDELKSKPIDKGSMFNKVGLHLYREDETGITERINQKVAEHVAPFAAKARERDAAVKQARTLSDRVKVLQKRSQEVKTLTNGLKPEQKLEMQRMANKLRAENQKERKIEIEKRRSLNRSKSRSRSNDRGGMER